MTPALFSSGNNGIPRRIFLSIICLFLGLIQHSDAFILLPIPVVALFGSKQRKKKREAELAALAAQRARISIFGLFSVHKGVVYALVAIVVGLVSAFVLFSDVLVKLGRKKKGNRPNKEGTVDVVVVGCGLPKKGMGWYHLTQLLRMPKVNVRAVVEPYFLNETLCKEKPPAFLDFEASLASMGVEMVSDLSQLGAKFTTTHGKKPTLCLIAGRTHENPKLFRQCIEHGARWIYLEKPGAPTVKELQEMRDLAASTHPATKVFVGYNKNVTPYVHKALRLAREMDNSHIFFCHANAYQRKDLPEVFVRNSEGMLKNMAVHELALLVQFFDVTVETIAKFKVNTGKLFSEKLTLWKPGTSMPKPEYITDFSKAAFKITTKDGKNVSVMADRCGGNISFAVVKDENGVEVKKFEHPDSELAEKVAQWTKEDPLMMPYFFVQSDDYLEMKKRVVNHVVDGAEIKDVATLDTAIEALRLAEYCTEKLNSALKAA